MSLIVCILLLTTFPPVLSTISKCGTVTCEPFGVCVSGICQCKSETCRDNEYCGIDKCYCSGTKKCAENEICVPNGATNECQAVITTPSSLKCENIECQVTETCYDGVCLCGGQFCGGLCIGTACFCGGKLCASDEYCNNLLCTKREEPTTAPATTEAPGFAEEICDGEPMDLVILIDNSGSVGSSDFALALNAAVDFTDALDIGTGNKKSRVGLATFDTAGRPGFGLEDYHTNEDTKTAINAIKYMGGGTHIRAGMEYALQVLLQDQIEARNVSKIMLLMTDGQDDSDVATIQGQAAAMGIVIYALGIGSGVDRRQLIRATGDENKVYMIDDFSALRGIVNRVCRKIDCGNATCKPFGVCESGVCHCHSDICKGFEFCGADKCYCFGDTKCEVDEKCVRNGTTNMCEADESWCPSSFRCGDNECQLTETCYDNVCLCGGQFCGGLCKGGACYCGGKKCESDEYCQGSQCTKREEPTAAPATTEAPDCGICENGHRCTALGCICPTNNYRKCSTGLYCDDHAGCVDPATDCGGKYCSTFERCENSTCYCGADQVCSGTEVCFNNQCNCGTNVCSKPGETCVNGECRCGLRKCDISEHCALIDGGYRCACGANEYLCKADSECINEECKCEVTDGVYQTCLTGTICVNHECVPAGGFADEICEGDAMDLVIVIDDSGSVGSRDFTLALNAAVDFAGALDIGTGNKKSRVGLVIFNSNARVGFLLDDYQTNADVAAAINGTKYVGGGTDIRTGMNCALTQVLDQAEVRNVPRIMLLMTDGQDSGDVASLQKQAATKGVVIYAIGIGTGVNRNQLIKATGDESKVFMISDFSGLNGIVEQVCTPIDRCYDIEKFCRTQVASCSTTLVLSYMQEYCRKTCGYCGTEGEKTSPAPTEAEDCGTCGNGHECNSLGCVCPANNNKKCDAGLYCDSRVGCVDPATDCEGKYCSAFETCQNSTCYCRTDQECSATEACFNYQCHCGTNVCGTGETCVNGECRCGLRKCDANEHCALINEAYQCACGANENICKGESECINEECRCEVSDGVYQTCLTGTICVDHECITAGGFADEICDGEAMDLVIVIDDSGSVGARDFALALNAAVDFTDALDIGAETKKSRVGLVIFNSKARVGFLLDDYQTNADVAAAINGTKYVGGGTDIRTGMNCALTQVLDQAEVRNVPRIMLLMTDGQDNGDVASLQKQAATKGVVIYAIGIGTGVNKNQLIKATGDESKVFMISDFSALKGIVEQVCTKIDRCYDIEKFCSTQAASCHTPSAVTFMQEYCRKTCGYCDCVDDPTLPVGECANNINLCYESSYLSLMSQICASTCELCESKCRDEIDCSAYLATCQDTDLSTRNFLGKNCRRSCGYCTGAAQSRI